LHLHRHRPVADELRIPAGGVDVTLDLEFVGADDAGQRVAGLHPFPLVREDLDHDAVQRRLDQPALDRVVGRLHLDALGGGGEGGEFSLQLGLLDLQVGLLRLQPEPVALHLRDRAGGLLVGVLRLLPGLEGDLPGLV